METQKIFCPAKLNFFLEVGDLRPDNYHNIDSVMQTVDLCDIVEVGISDGNGRINLNCNLPELCAPDTNIAAKAAKKYLEEAGKNDADVFIGIEKHIPVAAGLAGGSTDAAGVLLLMNRMLGMFDEAKLLRIGAALGADLPFCMMRGAARATGIGDKLERLRPLSREIAIVIAVGGERVSTAEAYRTVLPGNGSADKMASLFGSGDIYGICSEMYNAFEKTVSGMRPYVPSAKHIMMEYGALAAMMSGSGPSVFGLFSDYDLAERACDDLARRGYESFVSFSTM